MNFSFLIGFQRIVFGADRFLCTLCRYFSAQFLSILICGDENDFFMEFGNENARI